MLESCDGANCGCGLPYLIVETDESLPTNATICLYLVLDAAGKWSSAETAKDWEV